MGYTWGFPYNTSSPADVAAAQVHHDFGAGWWADPVFLTGDYPLSMRENLGDALPRFSDPEKHALKGSADFYGLNCYTATYVKSAIGNKYETTHVGIDGKVIGPQAASSWLYVVPSSI